MMNLLIGIGLLLILSILYMIFRIGRLVGVAKGDQEDTAVDGSNSLQAALLLIFGLVGLGAFFWYSYTHFDSYTLPVASEHGVETDFLFWLTMAVTVASFSIIFVVMFAFAYLYRYQEGRKAKFYPDNHVLELVWTIVPAIVLSLLIFTGLNSWNNITSPASAEAEKVELIGQQFAWTARYPGVQDKVLGKTNFKQIDAVNEFGLDLRDKNSFDDFKSLELHLPKGREILIQIRAKDVLHSVFLPHFRVKMDAVPGMATHFKFVVTKTTEEMRAETGNPNFNYELACTEICGRGHFSMRMLVVVEEPEAYEKWKASQQTWLKLNPEYMHRIPAELQEAARVLSGIEQPGEAGRTAPVSGASN